MITESILKEWRQDNASKRFPLDAVTSNDTLPPSFLVGLDVGIPPGMTKDEGGTIMYADEDYILYISEVVIGTSRVSVKLSSGAAGEVVAFVEVPTSEIEDQPGWTLAGLPNDDDNLQGITGTVYFGHPSTFLTSAGTYTLTNETGRIDVSCVHPYPDSFKGLMINGQLFTGDLTFVEGDGINLSFNDDNELVIAYEPETGLEGIYSQAELIAALQNYYGAPILSINGIAPTSDGDFIIGAAEDSCVAIDGISHGLTLENSCATPCCDKSLLETIAQAIQALNERSARLAAYLESASTNLNSLQNELSVLKIGLKQQ